MKLWVLEKTKDHDHITQFWRVYGNRYHAFFDVINHSGDGKAGMLVNWYPTKGGGCIFYGDKHVYYLKEVEVTE